MRGRTVSAAQERRRREHPPVPPRDDAPRYVRACQAGYDGDEQNAWTLQLRKLDGSESAAVTFRCNSRRHLGPCQDHWARTTYARIKEAVDKYDPADVTFWVFTLDKLGRYGGRRFRSRYEAFRDLPWTKMLRRFNHRLRKAGLGRLVYVSTAERHKDGWPHLNLIIVSGWLAEQLRRRDAELGAHPELGDDDRILAPAPWRGLAVAAGFGPRVTAEVARDPEQVAAYITKVAKGDDNWEPDGEDNLSLIGEVAKGTQAPVDAPKNFRSLRCSRGFLKPPMKETGWTGWMEDAEGNRIGRKRRELLDKDDRVVRSSGDSLDYAGEPGDVAVVLGGRHRPVEGPVWHFDADDGRAWPNAASAHRVQSAEAWRGPGRLAARLYALKPYDPDDPKQQPERTVLVPDSTGSFVYQGQRYRLEPKWLTLELDLRQPRGPPDAPADGG